MTQILTKTAVYDALCSAICSAAECEESLVRADDGFLVGGQVDSLRLVEALATVEECLGVEIDPEALTDWGSLNNLSQEIVSLQA